MEGRLGLVGRHSLLLTLAAAMWIALAASGCGGSSEPAGPTVTLRATSEFGQSLVASEDSAPLEGHRNVLRLLRDYADVSAVQDGDRIESVEGRYYQELPFRTTWAIIVNGVEADEGAKDYRLYAGDVAQVDLRYWDPAFDVRATVGAFPQTFTRGVFGKRFPVTVTCVPPKAPACETVKARLRAAGVAIDGSRPEGGQPPPGQPQRANVLVGEWNDLRRRGWAKRIDLGPRHSGVFATFDGPGGRLSLLDWEGEPRRELGAGTGLVAAMRPTEEDLLWIVTGIDGQGVARAAEALDDDGLRDAFAAVITPSGGVEKVPLAPPDGSGSR